MQYRRLSGENALEGPIPVELLELRLLELWPQTEIPGLSEALQLRR